VASTGVDVTSRAAIAKALKATVAAYGGVDILINTAALYPSTPDGTIPDSMWATTLDVT